MVGGSPHGFAVGKDVATIGNATGVVPGAILSIGAPDTFVAVGLLGREVPGEVGVGETAEFVPVGVGGCTVLGSAGVFVGGIGVSAGGGVSEGDGRLSSSSSSSSVGAAGTGVRDGTV